MKKITIYLIIAIISLGLVSLWPKDVLAQGLSLEVAPILFKLSLDPGEEKTEKVTLKNPNDFAIKIEVSVEDLDQADEKGSPQFLAAGSSQNSIARFLDIEERELVIEAKTNQEASFNLKIPPEASAGGYYGAVIYQVRVLEEEASQMATLGRVAVLLFLTIKGEKLSQTGEIVEFRAPGWAKQGPIEFVARFKNTGQIYYQTGGKITIKNLWGKAIGQVDLEEHLILPGAIRQFENQWTYESLLGPYQAFLEIKDGEGNLKKASLLFCVWPLKATLISLAILVVIVVLILLIKKYRRGGKRKNIRT